jgi:sulfopyruvate decarboxylase subunit alpha
MLTGDQRRGLSGDAVMVCMRRVSADWAAFWTSPPGWSDRLGAGIFVAMFSGDQIATVLDQLGVTHVITVPDSTIGQWQPAIAQRGATRVVRVCREGEAWQVAAGLYLGGASPVVMIQCTGLFESGDALRNVLHDWKLPIFSIIGYRSYLNQDTLPGDTCLVFTEPILDAWKIDYRLLTDASQFGTIAEHFTACQTARVPGAILVAEGKA